MLNEVRLIGRLGAAPDIKTIPSGKRVAMLSVSTWETWFNKAEQKFDTQTEWHRVICWGDQCERIAKMNTGDLVLVSGASRTREYTDGQGVKKWTTEIVGYAKPMPNSHGKASTGTDQQNTSDSSSDDNDLPF